MASAATKIAASLRDVSNSRDVRRLRRTGRVPGVLYGGSDEPVTFSVDARELRIALAQRGAVLEVDMQGGETVPTVLKDTQVHPVRGETMHIDLLRVDLQKPIQTVVPLELEGVDEAPGVVDGGVLDQVTRELHVEALPTAVPDAIRHDVSAMEMNDTLTLASITAPSGVTLLDDAEETVIATLAPPRVEVEPDEIEQETELVGEGEAGNDASADEAAGDADSGDSSDG